MGAHPDTNGDNLARVLFDAPIQARSVLNASCPMHALLMLFDSPRPVAWSKARQRMANPERCDSLNSRMLAELNSVQVLSGSLDCLAATPLYNIFPYQIVQFSTFWRQV